MAKFKHGKGLSINDRRKIVIVLVSAFLVLAVGSAILVRKAYQDNLKPLSSSNIGIAITIPPGSSPSSIAELLKDKGVIKSDWAMEWYLRNHDLRDKLQAGTYLFRPTQSVPEIADEIANGRVATNLVTILPGRRLDQIRSDLIKDGFAASDVDAALQPRQYSSLPALADKPDNASLEGYLYPESFQKDANTSAKQIVKQSLQEMGQHLTPDIRAAINKQGLTIHQGIILASTVEQEVNTDSDRTKVAQVFYLRLKKDMMLGSDVTARYGAIAAGKPASDLAFDSPYNTRIHKGLPIGPISNVSESSLQAVAHPANTDWLYFVSGDDGTTYFSKTLQEHEALTKKYCKKLCN